MHHPQYLRPVKAILSINCLCAARKATNIGTVAITVAAMSMGHSVETSARSRAKPTWSVLIDILFVTISGHMKSFQENIN
jgi:hypothetical protein